MSLVWLDLSPPQLQITMLSGVAHSQALDPGLDAGATVDVLQAIEPSRELRSCLDLLHGAQCILSATQCKLFAAVRVLAPDIEAHDYRRK